MATTRSRLRPWQIAALALLGFLLAAALAAWLLRTQIAGWAARSWCTSNGLTCELDVRALGLSGLRVEDLKVTGADGSVPLEAEEANIALAWESLFGPSVTLVDVTGPVIRARYREDTVELGGLEDLGGGGGGTTELPEMRISGARVEIETPAGLVVATGQFSGKLPYQGELQASIQPVELATGEDRLVLREGEADLSFVGFKIEGTAHLDLEMAEFDGLSARNVLLNAEMAETLQPEVNWSAEIGQFAWQGMSIVEGDLSGSLRPASASKREDVAHGPLSEIAAASISGSVAELAIPSVTAGPANITLGLERRDRNTLTADFALRGEAVTHAAARIGRLTLTGTSSLGNDLSRIEAEGDLVLEDGMLMPDVRSAIIGAIGTGTPFTAHARALKAWLDDALSAFSAGTSTRFERSGAEDWSLVTTGTLSAKTPGGAALSLNAEGTAPVLNITPESVEASGLLNLSGGRAPPLTGLIVSATRLPDGLITVETGGISLDPWTAEDVTLSADLDEVHFTNAGSVPRVQTVGEIEIEGPVYGNDFAPTRLFGGIEAALDPSGLRVQTFRTDCLGLDTSGIGLNGGVEIGDTSLQLCPRDGRVVRQADGQLAGTVELGAPSIPFGTDATTGTLNLDGAVLDWRAGQTARLDVTAGSMQLPLEFGGKTLSITAESPRLGFVTTQPPTLTASLGHTEFGGSLLPADLSLESAEFDALMAPGGLEGSASAERVEMRDRGEDPLYETLTGDLTANFSEGVMTVTGPVTTARAGQTVANASMTLDLLSLDGSGVISTPELVFVPGGLQPTALSERVRGFMSRARGSLQAEARFTLDGGSPSGTGWVEVSGFGIDSQRLGAVDGVNGRIEFSDILALSTPPGQTVRIGEISPGIPLEDGEVNFQLLGATEAIIERARWPFAGGELVVDESTWTIAGAQDILTIHANRLELTDIVNIFDLPDIRAEGTVSGTFPLEISGANAYVRDAKLEADETGGTIAYTGEVADAAAAADERVEMAFDALRNFQFSVLEVGVDGNLSGEMMITLKLIGKSPNVLDGAPFAFNIGIDSKLMQLINTGRSLSSTDWLANIKATEENTDEAEQ